MFRLKGKEVHLPPIYDRQEILHAYIYKVMLFTCIKKREPFRLLRNNDNRNLGRKIFIHVKENKCMLFSLSLLKWKPWFAE